MHVLHGGSGRPPALEVAVAHALLLRVARGELPETLRLYRPAPTVAFGRLDALREGWPAAVGAAGEHGFTPVLRAPGGHAAAYDEGTVGFDLVVRTGASLTRAHPIFRATSQALAGELAALGADARVGPVAGEYCRGDYTVNVGGTLKVVGTAQRAIRGASLLGGFVTVRGADRLRAVLTDVYAALGLDWDPATLGALEDAAPGVSLEAVESAVGSALAGGAEKGALDPATEALAAELEPKHRI